MTFKYGIKPYTKVPKRMKKEPSLTISQISRHVPKDTLMKSRKVGIEEAYTGSTPRFLAGYTTYKLTTRNTENGHQYRLTIYSPTPKVSIESKVIIDDPCPVFVFRYEYALAKRGNAFIFRTNGNPPIQSNPKLVPGVSHHGYRALQYLIKKTTRNGLSVADSRKHNRDED